MILALQWRKRPSVWTGGKPFFWIADRPSGQRLWVTWDRALQKWALKTETYTITTADSPEAARKAAKTITNCPTCGELVPNVFDHIDGCREEKAQQQKG